eukprot:TRINITY_DN5767_c0_g1_i3.p1 TRINITY_DN5767_c0_g1~~TRINITY_DN5767_c0_g1_i3.p1  ORF type:complete len:204 (+),score=72.86 TRINITY_DN5767_c0_g1_i3:57-668(+)
MAFLFGKRPKPDELVKKWKAEIRKEIRGIERAVLDIEREEKKVITSIKQLAKAGDRKSAQILAKELLKSKKAKERLYESRATLNSISMQLQQQLSMLRIAGCMQKSGQIMGMMNDIIKLPQLQAVMSAMGQEMMKAGLIEEMIADTFEDDELDEEADEEVQKVFDNILAGLPAYKATKPEPINEKDDDEVDDEMVARLAALSK